MSDIANRLRRSRIWIEAMICECDSRDPYKCNRCRALAEFPDPDAVGGLVDALRLPLLFCHGGEWIPQDRALWKHITGHDEATTKVMCDHIRAALAKLEKKP